MVQRFTIKCVIEPSATPKTEMNAKYEKMDNLWVVEILLLSRNKKRSLKPKQVIFAESVCMAHAAARQTNKLFSFASALHRSPHALWLFF